MHKTQKISISAIHICSESASKTGTGANTHSIHPYHRVQAYMLSNSTLKRLKQAQRRCSCFSVA